MNQTEKTMTTLLRAALWNRPLGNGEIPADTDWKAVLQCAVKQSVPGLVAAAIADWADTKGATVEEAVVESCLQIQFSTINTNRIVDKIAVEVMQRLAEGGYTPILIKGQGIAQYYLHPQLRCAGDIDLFLGNKTDETTELLRPIADHKEILTYHPKHLNLEVNGIEVEIHRYVINRDSTTVSKVLSAWCHEELATEKSRQQTISSGIITVPSELFDLVFVFYHLWHHQLDSGIGLRQFCDWAMILHRQHGNIDTERLKTLLSEAGLLRGWQVLGCILVEILGLPKEEFPFYHRHRWASPQVTNRIFKLGNFGYGSYEAFMKKNTYKGLLHKAITLFHFLKRDYYSALVSPLATWKTMRDFYHF